MTDSNTQQLIALLNEKIRQLQHEKAEMKKENNRLKKELKGMERAKDETI